MVGWQGRAREWSWDTQDLTHRPDDDDDAREDRVIVQGVMEEGVEDGGAAAGAEVSARASTRDMLHDCDTPLP